MQPFHTNTHPNNGGLPGPSISFCASPYKKVKLASYISTITDVNILKKHGDDQLA